VEFAQNVRIEAQGSVYINDFAVNSNIFCKYLKAQKWHGSIVGGEVNAQRGLDVMVLGSPGGTKTFVTSGSDFLVERKISDLDKAMQFCNANVKKIDTALKPVLSLVKNNPGEVVGKNAIIRKTLAKRKDLEEELRIMQAKHAHLEKQLNVEGACFVKVSRICYPDVALTIKGLRMQAAQQRENVRFYEDVKEGAIKTGAY
ncbi:MAG: FapA family protein, partial [Chitinivibrionales bacterium]|nr:FapA family protein [Chitinivibrionales bacterium]